MTAPSHLGGDRCCFQCFRFLWKVSAGSETQQHVNKTCRCQILSSSKSFSIWPKHERSVALEWAMLQCYISIHTLLRVIARIKVQYLVYHHDIFTFFSLFFFFNSNDNVDECIKRWLGSEWCYDNACFASMLCCSCKTAPSSWYVSCHFLGNTEATQGGTPSLLKTTAEASAPLFIQT